MSGGRVWESTSTTSAAASSTKTRPRGCSSGPTRAFTCMPASGYPRMIEPLPSGWRAIAPESRRAGADDLLPRDFTYRSDTAGGPTAGTARVDPLKFLARLVTRVGAPIPRSRSHRRAHDGHPPRQRPVTPTSNPGPPGSGPFVPGCSDGGGSPTPDGLADRRGGRTGPGGAELPRRGREWTPGTPFPYLRGGKRKSLSRSPCTPTSRRTSSARWNGRCRGEVRAVHPTLDGAGSGEPVDAHSARPMW